MINKNELLFCVDENNKPIKPLPRQFVHKKGIWHRTSHVWIISDKKEILCKKRSLLKDSAPGKWEPFFGGHLPPDALYLDHAITELKEELNLNTSTKELTEMFIYKLERGKEFIGVFYLNWNGDISELKLEPDEVDQVKWIDKKEVKGDVNKNGKMWSVIGYEDRLFKLLE